MSFRGIWQRQVRGIDAVALLGRFERFCGTKRSPEILLPLLFTDDRCVSIDDLQIAESQFEGPFEKLPIDIEPGGFPSDL